ncbi:MAG TPA: Ku protein [Ohtaekwangia sp.]|uniref:Ku protein n=1 Tax=Ohtaekwangia sp. TaxID=2066019 RepID=UPI002F942807
MATRWTGTLEFGLVTIPFKIGTKEIRPGADSPDLEKGNIIRIVDFFSKDEINLSQFNASFHIEPDKDGSHAFTLFQDGLMKNNKVAIGSFNMDESKYICLLHAEDDGICFELGESFVDEESLEDHLAKQAMSDEPEVKRASRFISMKKFFAMPGVKFF